MQMLYTHRGTMSRSMLLIIRSAVPTGREPPSQSSEVMSTVNQLTGCLTCNASHAVSLGSQAGCLLSISSSKCPPGAHPRPAGWVSGNA